MYQIGDHSVDGDASGWWGGCTRYKHAGWIDVDYAMVLIVIAVFMVTTVAKMWLSRDFAIDDTDHYDTW